MRKHLTMCLHGGSACSTCLHMPFSPKRHRSISVNPFGRKLDPETAGARDAPKSVQQSLFSAIRGVGYEGSAASSIAWKLIKACRPSMTESASSRALLSSVPLGELEELRACAVVSAGKETMSREPARAELVGDIIAMLDGYIANAKPGAPASAPPPVSMVVPGARSAARTAEFIAAATAKPSPEVLANETPDEKVARWGARLAAEKALESS